VISGFRREVAEKCTLRGYDEASSGNFLLTLRDNLSIPSSEFKNPEDGTDSLSETSVRNYHYSPRNNPE
jgi:hypothetical protein